MPNYESAITDKPRNFRNKSLHDVISAKGIEAIQLKEVNKLISLGANPNEMDSNAKTAVHLAVIKKKLKVLESLLNAGGCPLLSDGNFSALDLAEKLKDSAALSLMEKYLNKEYEEGNGAFIDKKLVNREEIVLPNCTDEQSFYSCTSETRKWVCTAAEYVPVDNVKLCHLNHVKANCYPSLSSFSESQSSYDESISDPSSSFSYIQSDLMNHGFLSSSSVWSDSVDYDSSLPTEFQYDIQTRSSNKKNLTHSSVNVKRNGIPSKPDIMDSSYLSDEFTRKFANYGWSVRVAPHSTPQRPIGFENILENEESNGISPVLNRDNKHDIQNNGNNEQQRENIMYPASSVGSKGSVISVVEEYLISDRETGHELLERISMPADDPLGTLRTISSRNRHKPNGPVSDSDSLGSVLSLLPESIKKLSLNDLKNELNERGFTSLGPLTIQTEGAYRRQLYKLRKQDLANGSSLSNYSKELANAMKDVKLFDWDSAKMLEHRTWAAFNNSLANWRGGNKKVSFVYLLLDPNITADLPLRATSLEEREKFEIFVRAIFYIGKGTNSRPFAHLYQALERYQQGDTVSGSPCKEVAKVSRILSIWASNRGVVCLQVFHNTIPAEAFTREAAMIDAMCLTNLTNNVGGTYYGPASSYNREDRAKIGVSLLHSAMKVFLSEGERQLRPPDLPAPVQWAKINKKK